MLPRFMFVTHRRRQGLRCDHDVLSRRYDSCKIVDDVVGSSWTTGRVSRPYTTFAALLPPTVLFSNHHLVAVHKPAGWRSIPADDRRVERHKCLLSWLKSERQGGGSQQDFLLPLHRIDQPCTGLLLLAKNRKAARRIQQAWRKGLVEKEYVVVVDTTAAVHDVRSAPHGEWHELAGSLVVEGRSVHVAPRDDDDGGRPCRLRYRVLASYPDEKRALLRVVSSTGARHQVRAMLSQLTGCPVVGDLRYGDDRLPPLPDQSVALHAGSVLVPASSVKLGGTDLTAPFVAPVPDTWKTFFGLTPEHVAHLSAEGDAA